MRQARWGWARRADEDAATDDLKEMLRRLAKRENSEITGEVDVKILNPGYAVLTFAGARENQPAKYDGWCFIIVSADAKWQGRVQATCPICEEVVRNYTAAPDPGGRERRGWSYQSEVPDWCELRPCGHQISGTQVELCANTEQGFQVHER